MKRITSTLLLCLGITLCAPAQDFNQITEDGTITSARNRGRNDSIQSQHKEIPKGLKVWTIDERFGDRKAAVPDTLPHLFMNTIFTTGMRGEYNTTGNLGDPRIHRIFINRPETRQFIFTQPYDYFIVPIGSFLFTNTYSPITNLSYNTAGDKTDGEDHLKALFAVNAGKRIGAGFKFDYLYGRGYYSNQNTALFNYTMYASYLGDRYQAHLLLSTNHQKHAENGGITNDNYITHPESFNDGFTTSEIPTVLEKNWNRNDNRHVFFTHRYSIGFNRKVPMTKEEIEARRFALAAKKENEEKRQQEADNRKAAREGRPVAASSEKKTFAGRPENAKIMGTEPRGTTQALALYQAKDAARAATDSLAAEKEKAHTDTTWTKNEYVPVTSFIHTAQFDHYRRIYQAYKTPTGFYADTFRATSKYGNDSIYDNTKHYALRNTFAIALLEGFNKWAKSGLKAFVTSELRHFSLPDSVGGFAAYNEHHLSIGGELSKEEGDALHYRVLAETWLAGEDAGQFKVDAAADLKFHLFGDTVQLEAKAFVHHLNPTFYYRHYHAKHYWWDHTGLDKEIRTRIEGHLSLQRTRTALRIAVDNIRNYTYMAQNYDISSTYARTNNTVAVRQHGSNINVLTAMLCQDFTLGLVNWENSITYQKSSAEKILPVPDLNIYTNLYLRFKIAKVLKCDLGADLRYFTRYYAPEYSPALGQYLIQEKAASLTKTGNYPIVNVYANFHLKHTRFFIMMSHINAGSGNRQYFLTPHYPLNDRILRLGLSWNFFN